MWQGAGRLAYNNGIVSGFKFEVRNSSGGLIGTYTTDSTGRINVPDLNPGSYTVTEVGLSDDFVAPANNPQTVTVVAGQTATVSFDNIKKRGVITIRKTNANPVMGDYSLAGAEFAIYNQGGALVETVTTGADGKAQSSILPLGIYTIKETKAPYGFLLDTKTYTAALSGSLGNAAIVYAPDVTVAEQPQPGRINIAKSNTTPQFGNYSLAGAVFEVKDASGQVVDTLTTDAEGKAQSKDLKLGTYTVTEKTAPFGFILNPDVISVTLTYAGQNEPVSYSTANVPEKLQPGIVRIHKQNSAPTLGDYSLKGAVFEVRAANGDLVDTVTTDEAGEAQTKELPLGTYIIREKTAPFGFVINTNSFTAVLAYAGQTVLVTYTDVTIPERPQTGQITVTKLDVSTGTTAQGDSTLNGAVFEVFKADKTTIADTIYCGSNTFGTTVELPLGTYYIKEKVPPVGYTLDPNFYEVKIEYEGQDVSVVTRKMDVKNKVIQGQIALVKHTDDPDPAVGPANEQVEKPLKDAKFEVFLKSAGSYEKTKETERDLLTTNSNGYAITKLLPYGVYTVREISAPGDVKLVAPFDVFISKDGQIYRYILNDIHFRSLVKIIKKDAETGATIPLAGTSFRVKDLSTGQWVTQHINYPTPIDIDVYETAPDGSLVMPAPLKSGDYELYEVSAPYVYTISNEPIKFTIHSTQADPTIIEVIIANNPVKGTISIEKKGNMVTGSIAVDTEYGKQYTPVFSEVGLPGAVFNIVAAEDIITPDGTVRAKKGAVVDTITTHETGKATSKKLYLGNYKITETTAPTGFVLDETAHPVSLVYENQDVPVVSSQIGIGNTRQQVEIELKKSMENPVGAGEGFVPAKDVIFGLYAEEDILAVDGSVAIAKDSLVALIGVDEDGNGNINFDELPFAKYYIKELRTNAAYELSEAIYPINVAYAGQDKPTAHFKVNGGLDMLNKLKYGQITIEKTGEILIDSTQSFYDKMDIYQPVYETRKLPGAVFDVVAAEDVIDVYGNIVHNRGDVADTITTGEDGRATTKPLHLGQYELVEIVVPYGMATGNPIAVTLGVDGEITDVISKFVAIHNERQKAELSLTKACEIPEDAPENFDPYASIRFGLYAKEDIFAADGTVAIPAGEVLEFFGVDESGKSIIQTDLPFGEFIVKEISTANGYALDGQEYPVIFLYDGDLGELIHIEINEGQIIENKLQRGSLKVIKVFEGIEHPVAGVKFTITGTTAVGTEVIIEAETDEDGVILLENLLVGNYVVKEIESKLTVGYVLSPEQNAEVCADEIAEMMIENVLIRGNVRLVKADKETGEKLAGVVFALYNADGEKIGEYNTDENGVIFIEDLPYGIGYYFVEIEAPSGYKLEETPISFDITEDGALVEVFAENEKIPDEPTIPDEPSTPDKPDSPDSPKSPGIPKTGDDFAIWPWIAMVGISLGGIVSFFIIRRKKKRNEIDD